MEEQNNATPNRIVGLDILRLIAMAFVVILHVNGYAFQTYGAAISNSDTTLFSYRLLEATAYPAIHLFVMISVYFLCDQKFKLKRLLQLWINVFIVTFSGLIIYLVFSHRNVSIIGLLRSVFPFTGQAYWFVSTYVAMIFLSPFINKLIASLKICNFTYCLVF